MLFCLRLGRKAVISGGDHFVPSVTATMPSAASVVVAPVVVTSVATVATSPVSTPVTPTAPSSSSLAPTVVSTPTSSSSAPASIPPFSVVHSRDVGRGFLALLFLLALLVVDKVVQDRRLVVEGVNDFQHRLRLVGRDLLGVPAVGHRLVLVVLQADVPQLGIRHVLHIDPLDLKITCIAKF